MTEKSSLEENRELKLTLLLLEDDEDVDLEVAVSRARKRFKDAMDKDEMAELAVTIDESWRRKTE